MAILAPRLPLTAEELFDLRDGGGRCELVSGEIIRLTPIGAEHGVVTARIASALDEYVEANDLGVCCGADTGFILERDPDTVRAPDAAVVLASRVPASGVPVGYWPFAPDLAVEVISPSDRLADVHVKIAEYFAAGTRLVWLVEPETRMVHVYRSPQQVEVLGIDDDLDGGDVLPGFQCPIRRLFPSDS
ncbi:MAG: Uma2 family endonuclease [Gemmatimonadota bacterium]|nr:Uma2 family endonuclease [Gemmatimonadota bacterium]